MRVKITEEPPNQLIPVVMSFKDVDIGDAFLWAPEEREYPSWPSPVGIKLAHNQWLYISNVGMQVCSLKKCQLNDKCHLSDITSMSINIKERMTRK